MRSCLPAFAHLAVVLASLLYAASDAQAQRVALLIGNANYTTAPLTNPPNDVRVMEAALKKVGFKVQTVLNANQNQMKRALRDFGDNAQGAEVAFLYYSGHGTQAGGENYLIPLQANINKESDYEIEAVGANGLMRQIAGARPKAAIVVLDACRDNPLAAATKSTSKGLGRMDAPTGSMIAFATAPNTTASDEGFYARELARQIMTPGLELYDVFRNTTAEVQRASKGRQVPRLSEVSITEKIYLAGTGISAGVQLASVRPEPTPQIQSYQAQPSSPAAGQVFKDCADCPEMVVIPAGSFQMGSNDGRDAEKPIHSITIKSFAMGKTEVTQGQWKLLMGNNPSDFKQCGDDCPVDSVTWSGAQEYIQRLNQKTGENYRLPSEAEWEYACRAGGRHRYCGGDDANAVGWYGPSYADAGNSAGTIHRAAVKQANAFGLFDMSGNVEEWVQDWFHENYSEAPADGSAWESGSERKYRVFRGGSWIHFSASMRSASRNMALPADRAMNRGFRLARTLFGP